MHESVSSQQEVPIEAVKERGWQEVAAINQALQTGILDEAGWHQAMANLIRPAYLAASTPWGQSGHSGDQARWTSARRLVVDALEWDGTFLDGGCANGYLMECVQGWAADKGLQVEPYGVDIVPELVDLARRRLPGWAERIWVGNLLGLVPPRRFDVVRVGLEYVPDHRRADLVAHLLGSVVAEGGRLVVGPYTEEVQAPTTERELVGWGYRVAGRSEVAHPDPRVVRRLVWIDAPDRST